MGNENPDEIIEITKADLTYICNQVRKPKNIRNVLKTYRVLYIYIYIHMENATEPINEEAATKQQHKVEELRKYNRDYDHAHTNASECEHCKKTASIVSAVRRRQAKHFKCKLMQ
ncbi:MAG: hypothetical protein ACKPKO_14590, partial [Candidatus Fonsibacter sp.]